MQWGSGFGLASGGGAKTSVRAARTRRCRFVGSAQLGHHCVCACVCVVCACVCVILKALEGGRLRKVTEKLECGVGVLHPSPAHPIPCGAKTHAQTQPRFKNISGGDCDGSRSRSSSSGSNSIHGQSRHGNPIHTLTPHCQIQQTNEAKGCARVQILILAHPSVGPLPPPPRCSALLAARTSCGPPCPPLKSPPREDPPPLLLPRAQRSLGWVGGYMH